MLHACRTPRAVLFIASAGLLAAAWSTPAGAAPPKEADIADDFRAMAQQRPWRCEAAPARPVPATGWSGEPPACAWQNRLRTQTWRGPGGPQNTSCISAQASWWNWTRAHPSAWQASWPSHSMRDDSGPEKRIVVIRQLPEGEWSTTEWRWSPSPRAATRAWQQGRWNALAARAGQFMQQVPVTGTPEARMLTHVLQANLGKRAAELAGDVFRWQSDGLCLNVDAAAPGAQQLQLPFSVDDSRLEQRAAMQLQLARRYPAASWLSTFNLVPTPRHVRSGAKFYAVWLEGATVKGQLWMPTKGNGPLVRVRIAAELPAVPADAIDNPAVTLRKRVIERELMNVAARWAFVYE